MKDKIFSVSSRSQNKNMINKKICTLCKDEQLIEEFRRDKTKKDGFHPHCKTCQRAYRKQNRSTDSVAKEGERRRHYEYNRRKEGKFEDVLSPTAKSSLFLKKYYSENPDVLEKKKELIYSREEYFINSKSLNKLNSRGEKFRSALEVKFSELLIKNNIKYQYEVVFKLINGKRKVVDFFIEDFLIVEISGYAHEKWKADFDAKIRVLRQSTDLPIFILTYPKFAHEITQRNLIADDMFFDSIENEQHILRGIKFYDEIRRINEMLKQRELCIE